MCRFSLVPLSGTGKKREGIRGEGRLHWRVQESRSSPTKVGSRQREGGYDVMEFGMSRRIKSKKNMCTFQ